ncbi:hypothetical protein DMN91_002152 [Ooceraea biroi]|uniref:Reverse transcriptase domain-containing protein n=1 Tax=Ooceraea biroi TaxID=2015173 RepID=A0A3L8E1C2_OOCBI|nr:uncharacterized protein LOC105285982 [Ooceraea biroi]RLU25989.1 hypothetical protein DMN91_002152 [Ooceraea biroi]
MVAYGLPRAYGLPKIHKDGCPLRIIVSCINSPLYALSSFLHDTIHENIVFPKSHVKNSYQLVNELRSINLDSNVQFVSFDVVSLFTNVPLKLAIKSVERRWDSISEGTTIPLNEFLIGLKFVLDSTYFSFNGCVYKQIFGTPMGSPVSPTIADVVPQDLEDYVFHTLNYYIPVYYRYVGDVLLATNREYIDDILETFNSFHNRLQFTKEESNNHSINFLDVSIIFNHGSLSCDWYRKPTFSGRYLSYYSHHSTAHKRGVVFGLVDKVVQLSDPQYHEKNLKFVINCLLDNGYLVQFIFSNITRRRLKKFSYGMDNNEDVETNGKKVFYGSLCKVGFGEIL